MGERKLTAALLEQYANHLRAGRLTLRVERAAMIGWSNSCRDDSRQQHSPRRQ